MRTPKNIFTTLMLLLITLYTFAQENTLQTIPTFELKQLFDLNKEFTLIDARSSEEYENSHIMKAINIPFNELIAQEKQLPTNKEGLIITYCNGVNCKKSFHLAEQLKGMGYTNIMVYQEGIPIWTEVGYSLESGKNTSNNSSCKGASKCSKTSNCKGEKK